MNSQSAIAKEHHAFFSIVPANGLVMSATRIWTSTVLSMLGFSLTYTFGVNGWSIYSSVLHNCRLIAECVVTIVYQLFIIDSFYYINFIFSVEIRRLCPKSIMRVKHTTITVQVKSLLSTDMFHLGWSPSGALQWYPWDFLGCFPWDVEAQTK